MNAARVLDGRALAAEVRARVRDRALALERAGSRPGLAVVLVGDDPASAIYVKNKDKAAHEAGFDVRTLRLPASTAQAELERALRELSADARVHGILLQLPLPKPLDARAALECIDPAKDVDGLTRTNVAALALDAPGHRPCTPLGCLALLDAAGIALAGRELVVIGRSQLVGKPIALLSLARDATVTIAHSKSRDLAALVARAEVLVAAAGKQALVRAGWVRPGAAVLDVGIHRLPGGGLAGDVEPAAAERAGWITPVPGGVGPMTIAMLLENTLRAAEAATASAAQTTARRG